ncbi:family 1 glycosylhydrolase [Microbacterium pygmaeum]|uniref:Beta-glucosidase/6-phospho-beta-glucosidase/beta-galactosidase n=1 Tax=Microbacterium pygmaeum TaxID=370764 RepID=A0A1G7UGH9_9MICO|nr:family 1 glycosylhydrolase [Microbacterium pygmaeum]SDG46662.1 Beta-glucosidase/6-phospho-beta-glucosidase/beta-galactosidase [Microbacterium pygmaeum]
MTRWFEHDRLRYGVGIEDTFIPQIRPGHRRLDEYELTQHYSHWREDLDLVAESGAEFVRWGVPWYLVEPEPGLFDWSWTDQVAEHMRSLGLRCIVDLMHYGTPTWLDNAFLNSQYPERIASYACAVAERYRGVWDDFTPLNEPIVNAEWCGEMGNWPPYLEGTDGFLTLVRVLAKGMVRTQQEISAVNPDAVFVHVDAGFRYEGETTPLSRAILEERRFLALDLITGRVDDAHPLRDWLGEHGYTDEDLVWFAANAVQPDVLGVNYYPTFTTIRMDEKGGKSPVVAGTAGLRDLVQLYSARYGLPIIITETSLVGSPEEKIAWLRESEGEILALRSEGVPVVGYTWFPFLDLVDWLYRFDEKPADAWMLDFGLVNLVRGGDQQLARRKNAAFEEYQAIARRHRR